MKKTVPVIIVSLIFSLPASARPAPPKGISGEISINALFSSSTSNFNTDGEEVLTSINQSASSESGFVIAPLGNIAYTFGKRSEQQLFAGTTRSDVAIGTLALELGYKYQLASGTSVSIAYLPTVMSSKTWADPYKVGTKREETDESGNAYRLRFENIQGSPLSLDFAYATKDIDNEQITRSELFRNGESYYLKGQYRLMLNRGTILMPALTYIDHQADGNANSYQSYALDLSYFQLMGRHQLALTAGYTYRDYDGENSLYNNTVRSDDEFSLFAAYEYNQLMGWQNWSLISLAGYGNSNSNITFYDESQLFASVGINFKF